VRCLLLLLLAACGRIDYTPVDRDGSAPTPDAAVADAPIPDAAPAIDAPAPDAPPPDARPLDAALPDAALPDAALPDASPYEYVWLECESGTLVGAMTSVSDASASGGAYVTVPAGPAEWLWSSSAPALPPSRVDLALTLAHAGDHVVWVRFYGVSETADGWYAGFAAADLRRFFDNTSHGAWAWLRGNNDTPTLLTFTLTAGAHTLTLGPGEAGPRCDRVLVTDDLSYVPGP
jgi:hypothetical protein